MDGNREPRLAGPALVRTAYVALHAPDPVGTLAGILGDGPFALISVFADPDADFTDTMTGLQSRYPQAQVIGCTTAGEISQDGYSEGGIVATALPTRHFTAHVLFLDKLHLLESHEVIGDVIRARSTLTQTASDMAEEFAFLLVDGLSLKEDELASNIASGLGGVPLFGGSAGDGIRFKETFVGLGGRISRNAAVLALVRSHCPVRVFTLNHFTPTEQRMVVTSADPSRRVVHSINAEPAAREMARILGKNPDEIDTFTFASNPVVVRFGGNHHVRAIKRVTEDGYLEFFSAIDEGLVLTLADAKDMVGHLDRTLAEISADGAPDTIIACDCLLRRIEAEQKQQTRALSNVLAKYHVAGFSTYGEQINALHVNQTMTGVAIFPPKDTAAP